MLSSVSLGTQVSDSPSDYATFTLNIDFGDFTLLKYPSIPLPRLSDLFPGSILSSVNPVCSWVPRVYVPCLPCSGAAGAGGGGRGGPRSAGGRRLCPPALLPPGGGAGHAQTGTLLGQAAVGGRGRRRQVSRSSFSRYQTSPQAKHNRALAMTLLDYSTNAVPMASGWRCSIETCADDISEFLWHVYRSGTAWGFHDDSWRTLRSISCVLFNNANKLFSFSEARFSSIQR